MVKRVNFFPAKFGVDHNKPQKVNSPEDKERFLISLPQLSEHEIKDLNTSLGGKAKTWLSYLRSPVDALIISRAFFNPGTNPEGVLKFSSPSEVGINCDEISITTIDGKLLHGYFFPGKNETKNTLIFLHGRTGCVDNYYPVCLKLQEGLEKQGTYVNAFIFDYRGFGKSSGKRPTRSTVLIDTYGAFEYLKKQRNIPPENICIVGHSSGAAVALGLANVASENGEKLNSVIVASGFSSPKAAAVSAFQSRNKKIPRWILFLVSNKLLNPERFLRNIEHIPIVFIHGEKDALFSCEHARSLYDISDGSCKQLILIPGAGHKDLFEHLSEEHFRIMARLFKE